MNTQLLTDVEDEQTVRHDQSKRRTSYVQGERSPKTSEGPSEGGEKQKEKTMGSWTAAE